MSIEPIELQGYAYAIRENAIRMVARADSSHIGGTLSMADILAVLYGSILRVKPEQPDWPDRDRFLLSKGHCCSGVYAALALKGFFPVDELDTYGLNGSRLMCHVSHAVPGVDWSTGSLGHALGIACGQALIAKRTEQAWRVFVLMSDGELDEGSVWEAILFAGHHKLANLQVIIDFNKIQSLGSVAEVLDLGSIAAKFEAFGWDAAEVDGHDIEALQTALSAPPKDKPRCLIAHTIKGKGVDFMENKLEWHYRAPKTAELLDLALAQLKTNYLNHGIHK